MIVRIQVRRGTSTQWTNANPVLHSGEFGYETDTGKIKIGNGSSTWNTLSYLQGSGGGGEDGLSAYQIAVNNGFTGTEQEWLISLQGADGVDGANGKSAYDIAVQNGFVGTEQDWIESLSPIRFLDADVFEGDGETPETKTTIRDGSIIESMLSQSVQVKINYTGSDGDSAYQIALNNGFVGTEQEWLESLRGADGMQGETGPKGDPGDSPEASLRESNTVLFDKDYIIGESGSRTGNVIIDTTEAKRMSVTTMLHNDSNAFSFFYTDGTTPFVFIQEVGTYVEGADNWLDFQYLWNNGVRLTISQ